MTSCCVRATLTYICLSLLPFAYGATARNPRVAFSTYLSGNSETAITASTIDANGNMYVTGFTRAKDFPTTAGAFRPMPPRDCQANSDSCAVDTPVFVAKFNKTGSDLIYSTYVGTGFPTGIAVDKSGNAYVVGITAGKDMVGTTGAWQRTCEIQAYANCAWLLKLNATGSARVYENLLGSTVSVPYLLAIAVNANGQAYVGGSAPRGWFTSTNALRRTITNGPGGLVMKFSAGGNSVLYSTYVSGQDGNGQVLAIAVDGSDRAVVVGGEGGSFPTTASAVQRTNAGNSDVFVSKLKSDGSAFVASTLLGGNEADTAYGVAVDSSSNVYVGGRSLSSTFPTTSGALRTKFNTTLCGPENDKFACSDGFVSKLSPGLTKLIYSTYLGGTGDDWVATLGIDTVGHAFVTGGPSADFPLVKAVQTTPRLMFVAKLNTSGNGLLFSTFFGGNSLDRPHSISVDKAGDTYIAGDTDSTTLPTTSGAFQTFNHSADHAAGFAVKFEIPPCTLSSTSPSVTICSPGTNASVSSPVLVGAGATDGVTVTSMKVFVDSSQKYSIGTSHFETRVSLGSGTHRLTVTAADSLGRTVSTSRNFTVK